MTRRLDPERWAVIERLLDEVEGMPPEAVDAVLRQRCGDDEALRHEVSELLAAEAESSGFLETPWTPARWLSEGGDDEDDGDGAESTEVLGSYRLSRRLGGGGMADVYLAVREDGDYRREVAIKRIRRDLGGPELRRRFRRERAILGRLEHPGIARLYDSGRDDAGRPYLVMERIDGEQLDAYCDRRRATLDERLALFVQLCDAVHDAHRHLLVHRDLKPSNILVTADGELKLIDFGIAKAIDIDDQLTRTARAPMSLAYASPEQVRGESISTASDLFSLGIVLYELLCGQRPYEVDGAMHGHQLAQAVCEAPAPLMSAAVRRASADDRAAFAERRQLAPRELARRLAGDLDSIVAKALEKEPDARYATVVDLAQDLDHYRHHRPVSASRRGRLYPLGKFVRRHRLGVAVAGAFAVLLAAFVGAQVEHAERMEQERDKVARAMDFMVEIFEVSRPDTPFAASANALLDRAARRAVVELRGESEVQATLLDTLGRVYRNLGLVETAEDLLDQAVALRRDSGSPGELAQSLGHLGSTVALRDFEAAIAVFDQALDVGVRAFGDDDPRLVTIRLAKAHAWVQLQRFEEAERLLRQILAAEDPSRPSLSPVMANTREVLAILLLQTGDGDEARRLAEAALDSRRRIYGADHPRVASSLESLGSVLRHEGRLVESAERLGQAVAIRRRLASPTDTELLLSIHHWALTLQQLGRSEQAEALFREELARLDELFPGDHVGKGSVLFNLSTNLSERDRLDEALALARRNLEMQRRLFGDRHPRVAPSWLLLGRVQRQGGDLDAAEATLRVAVEVFDATRPPGHPGRPMPRVELGATWSDQGRYDEAEQMLRPALDALAAVLPKNHHRRALAARHLGVCLARQGRYDEAESLLLTSHEALLARGEAVPGLRQVRADLVDLYHRWGRPDLAASYVPPTLPER